MGDKRDPETDQQLPTPNQSRPIADLVCEDLQKRKEHGTRKYGTPLQAGNGRSALRDAYEEVLDLAQYLKQRIVEEESASKEPPCPRFAYHSDGEDRHIITNRDPGDLCFFCKVPRKEHP